MKVVISLQSYRAARQEGASQRDAARRAGLPRSTLGDLDGLGKRNGVIDERDALVLSPAGLALVRQLIDAALMVFCVASGVGLPTFRRFLALSGLDVTPRSWHIARGLPWRDSLLRHQRRRSLWQDEISMHG
jgi:hypothetical protein